MTSPARGVVARSRSLTRGLLLAALLALAVGGCSPAPDPDVRPLGGLVIRAEPVDALVFVDERYMGTVSGLKFRPLMLPEGGHRVEIRRDGYFAHFAEVQVARGVRQRLQVKLREEPY